jgi:hypothetical protein
MGSAWAVELHLDWIYAGKDLVPYKVQLAYAA